MKKGNILITVSLIIFSTILVRAQDVPPPPERTELEYFWQVGANEEKEILAKLSADIKKELEEIKKLDKKKYLKILQESRYSNFAMPFILGSKMDKKRREQDKLITELDIKSKILSVKLLNDKKANKEKLKQQLNSQLSKLFELKEKRKKEEINRLEEKLSKLKNELTQRKKHKKEIIERRILELIGEEDYLKWE